VWVGREGGGERVGGSKTRGERARAPARSPPCFFFQNTRAASSSFPRSRTTAPLPHTTHTLSHTHIKQVPEPAKHYGLATKLPSPLDPASGDGLALQYELKLGPDGWTCGGGYMKLVTEDSKFTPEGLVDSTPYSIMFGPDKCGATNKVSLMERKEWGLWVFF
jgi:hypothetical protein